MHQRPTSFRLPLKNSPVPIRLLYATAAVLIAGCTDTVTVLMPSEPDYSIEHLAGRSVVAAAQGDSLFSIAGDPPGEDCSAEEDDEAGDDPSTPCYVLPGIDVVVPQTPIPDFPPPPPIDWGTPAYTPPNGGWGTVTFVPSRPNDPFDPSEVEPPPIEGAFADGPVSFIVCVAARAGIASFVPNLQTLQLTTLWMQSTERLNRAEAVLQTLLKNANEVGEEMVLVYQMDRDAAQREYDQARTAVRNQLQISSIAMSGAAATCALAAWIPWF